MKILKLIVINILVFLVLILAFDFALTKLNLVELKCRKDGKEFYGFSHRIVEIFSDSVETKDHINIAVIGDSHHQFVTKDSSYHQSVVLKDYLEENGQAVKVFSLGTPRYSFVQEIIAYETLIKPQEDIDYLIFLFYAGNDFAEILRNDDRPRIDFDLKGEPILKNPDWLMQRPPELTNNCWPRDSRIYYSLNTMIPNNMLLKVLASFSSIEVLNPTLSQQINYFISLNKMRDDRFGYQGAAAAQFLNQYYLYDKWGENYLNEVEKRVEYFFNRLNQYDEKVMLFFLPSAPAIGGMEAENEIILKEIENRLNVKNAKYSELENRFFNILKNCKAKTNSKVAIYDLSTILENAIKEDKSSQGYYDKPTIHIDKKARKIVGHTISEKIISNLELYQAINNDY